MSTHRTEDSLAASPYDPPTHPALRPVDPYGPVYDPGAYGDPDLQATSVIPRQSGPVDARSLAHPLADPLASPDVAHGWATREQEAWHDPSPGAHTWDREDYADEYQDHDDEYAEHDEYQDHDDGPDQAPDETPGPTPRRLAALLVPVAVGIAVSVGLGVYGRLHEGTGSALNIAGFSSGLAAKTWLSTAAFVLVLVQLWTAMRMYGRLSRRGPAGARTAFVHRWSGRAAVLLTIPVAVHCLYALGYEDTSPRVLLHSLAGCFFYGAFTAKMLLLPRRDAPRWALPMLGGLVFVLLTALFLTSSVWFFSTRGLTF